MSRHAAKYCFSPWAITAPKTATTHELHGTWPYLGSGQGRGRLQTCSLEPQARAPRCAVTHRRRQHAMVQVQALARDTHTRPPETPRCVLHAGRSQCRTTACHQVD